jgi:thiamine phosphate synthase YjbQ (UPF0047 family)
MSERPKLLTVETRPRSRYDATDVTRLIRDAHGDVLDRYRRVLYCSHHTTAGYLDQRLANWLLHRREGVDPFIRQFQRLFPYGAGYRHDDMRLRAELTDEQRRREPANGDAHLTFIGSGLQNCVTYQHRPGVPVFLMDLDGVCDGVARTRTSSVVAFTSERKVEEFTARVPVSRRAIDSINLYEARLGIRQRIDALLRAHPASHGRLDIAVEDEEEGAAVTVNEYETLLMRHDLAEVLRDPVRFVARQGRRMLRDPKAVPAKSLGYARYDVVQVVNRVLDVLGPGGDILEAAIARFMAIPAARRLRFKRSLSLAVGDCDGHGPRVVRGRFQTPILIQWRAAPQRYRTLRVAYSHFD